jgi:hypothetical protein
MRAFFIGFILIALATTASARAAEGEKSFKGWELYIWKEGADWKFALLPGTNRLKDDGEIKAAAVTGLDAIEKKLDSLAAQQEVFLSGRTLQSKAPIDVARDLVEYGDKHGLVMRTRE